jgi:[amino group carrier protein]-L-2-aminoadipate 6-kinase
MGDLTVVKCGGTALVDSLAVCEDVAALHRAGETIVVVHGGSADIDRLGQRLGVPMRRLADRGGASARRTDTAVLEVVTMALAGLTKPRLVATLMGAGVLAVGLTGLDGGLLQARRKPPFASVVDGRRMVVRDDHSGRVTGVNADLLHGLLAASMVPVISPPALAEDGTAVNTDADRAAAKVAAALGADTLVMLTGAPGVLADAADEGSVMPICAVSADGPPPYTGGGMAHKLLAAREALLAGVPRVLVADGRRAQPVRSALAGRATVIALGETEREAGG